MSTVKKRIVVGLIGMCIAAAIVVSEAAEKSAKYLRDLKNSDPAIRKVAAEQLGAMRARDSIDALVNALQDKNVSVRKAAVDALGILRAKKAAASIANMLVSDPDVEVRQLAAIALGSAGDDTIGPSLIKAMSDKHIGTRLEAIKTSGKIRVPLAVDPLINALKDTNPTVREYTVIALGKINDKKAVAFMEPLLKDAVPQVRKKSAYALGVMGAKKSIKKIKKLLSDPVDEVQLYAALALGRLQNSSGNEVAVKFLKHTSSQKRRMAVEIIGLTGKRVDIKMLEEIIKTDTSKTVQRAAKQAVRFINQRFPKNKKKDKKK